MSEGRERSEVLGSNGLHWLWATGADWFVTCVFHKELGGQVVSEQLFLSTAGSGCAQDGHEHGERGHHPFWRCVSQAVAVPCGC